MDTVGVGGGAVLVLSTVIDTPALVVLLLEVSLATAVSVCFPFARVVVFRDCEYGVAVCSEPKSTPSSRNCTLAMPILLEALAVTVTVLETVAPDAGEVMDTVGGGVVLVLLTVMDMPALVVLVPEVSLATAVSVCFPFTRVVVFRDWE
jgi:hypothetical protein